MGNLDIGWKEGLEIYLEQAMALLFPEAHAQIDWSRGYEFLDKELQQIMREGEIGPRLVDKLAKVYLKNGEERWVLLHVDVQGEPQDQFEWRMYVYNYRIFDRYNRMVASFAILADDKPDWRPGRFGYSLLGCQIDFRFPTAKLLDFVGKEAELEASENVFAVVILAYLKARQTVDDPGQRRFWKLRLIRSLYERGVSRRDVQEVFRLIDWFMVLPPQIEDEIWQDIQQIEQEMQMQQLTYRERKWLESGKSEGLAEGRAEARADKEKLMEMALRIKFGAEVTASLMPAIRSMDATQFDKAVSAFESAISPEELLRSSGL